MIDGVVANHTNAVIVTVVYALLLAATTVPLLIGVAVMFNR